MAMKTLSAMAAVLTLGLIGPPAGLAQQAQQSTYKPGLIEFMTFTQIRHAKLWLAGSAGNWELADFEIDELKEGLENAAKHVPDYKGMPVGKMIETIAMAPIDEVEQTIKAKDRVKFTVAYDKLTAACNSCHQSANPNQSFAPRRN
jgi:hypothetical protein